MPLSVVLGNVLEDSVVMEPRKNVSVSRIVNYKWKENLKVEFVENLKSNGIQLCMGGIESALNESTTDRTLNILYLVIKEGEA
jgi:hypothetical protein